MSHKVNIVVPLIFLFLTSSNETKLAFVNCDMHDKLLLNALKLLHIVSYSCQIHVTVHGHLFTSKSENFMCCITQQMHYNLLPTQNPAKGQVNNSGNCNIPLTLPLG